MPKRILKGVVVSNSSDKTVHVRVERKVKHPLYKKFIRRAKKYAAHDNIGGLQVGQTVRIQESSPISKTKAWVVVDSGSCA